MTYARRQHTAYGVAMVSGENAFPQPPEPTYASNKNELRAVHDKIVASAEKCIAYKKTRRESKKELPDGNYQRLINDMYRSMALASGPANLRPTHDMPKTTKTLRALAEGDDNAIRIGREGD